MDSKNGARPYLFTGGFPVLNHCRFLYWLPERGLSNMAIPVVFPCVICLSYIRSWHCGGLLLAVTDLGISAAPLAAILTEF